MCHVAYSNYVFSLWIKGKLGMNEAMLYRRASGIFNFSDSYVARNEVKSDIFLGHAAGFR